MTAWDDERPCAPGEHTFRRDPETNEPIGRCLRCETTVEWAERESEQAEDDLATQACADVAPEHTEAYLAALDAESIRERR